MVPWCLPHGRSPLPDHHWLLLRIPTSNATKVHGRGGFLEGTHTTTAPEGNPGPHRAGWLAFQRANRRHLAGCGRSERLPWIERELCLDGVPWVRECWLGMRWDAPLKYVGNGGLETLGPGNLGLGTRNAKEILANVRRFDRNWVSFIRIIG